MCNCVEYWCHPTCHLLSSCSMGFFCQHMIPRTGGPTRRDTTMTFTTFVMFDMFNALCCRSADKIVPQMHLFANKAFLYSVGGSLLGQVNKWSWIFSRESVSYDFLSVFFTHPVWLLRHFYVLTERANFLLPIFSFLIPNRCLSYISRHYKKSFKRKLFPFGI